MKKECFTFAEVPEARQHNSLAAQLLSRLAAKRAAFTLAEVLITLAIIGVVAAMTIPTLINKYQEKQTVSKLTKIFATLNNAFTMAKTEYGPFSVWFSEKSSSSLGEDGIIHRSQASINNEKIFLDRLKPYLKVIQDCGSQDDCKKYDYIYNLHGNIMTVNDIKNTRNITLADGTDISRVYIHKTGSDCSKPDVYCGDFVVDLNGVEKGPNTVGKDIFYFLLTSENIQPFGSTTNAGKQQKFPQACSLSRTENTNGYACSAWVLYNKNMDYLHCDDLSWDGKHSCKD